MIVSLCLAAGSLGSGEVLAAYGYGAAALAGGAMALVILGASVWFARATRAVPQAVANPPIAS